MRDAKILVRPCVALHRGSAIDPLVVRWEYRILLAGKDASREKVLGVMNELGLEGWEMVAVRTRQDRGSTLYFKRQLLEPVAPAER